MAVVNCVSWWEVEQPNAVQAIVTQRFLLSLIFFELPVVERDTEIRSREAGKEPHIVWFCRKLGTPGFC